MDKKTIEEYMDLLDERGYNHLSVTFKDGTSLEIQKAAQATPAPMHIAPQPASPASKDAPIAEGSFVESPMVGTFYQSPSPDAEPFIKVGDSVSENTVVCIVEAMKVMNEVKAGTSGIVKEVLVESGHPVEFGTRLFRIE